MKTTITVSVRDGWLTARHVRDDDKYSPRLCMACIPHVVSITPGMSGRGRPLTNIRLVGDAPHAPSFFIDGVGAAEVMELIFAGSGTITREVENG